MMCHNRYPILAETDAEGEMGRSQQGKKRIALVKLIKSVNWEAAFFCVLAFFSMCFLLALMLF